MSGWLLDALEKAGRGNELLAVYESEARATGSYERLVRYLISEKRLEDAERWAREGIEKTRDKLPGIADALAGLLCDVSRKAQLAEILPQLLIKNNVFATAGPGVRGQLIG